MRFLPLLILLLAVSCTHHREPFTHDVTTAAKPWTHESFKNDPDAFQFAILTDRTGGMRPGVFKTAVGKVNTIQPEFVVSVGDYIEGYTTDLEQVRTEWDAFDQLTSRFEMPFFHVPGNHDITNAGMQDLYEDRFGRRYYAFVYRDVLFLCLDTQDRPVELGKPIIGDAGLLTEQVEWARETLREHQDARWTIVLMHQPLWLYDSPEASEAPNGWDAVESELGDRPYTVFAGHLHRYTKHDRHDRDYIVLATTGGGSRLRGPVHGEFDHAVWVTMTGEGPRIANLMLEGIQGDEIYTERTASFHRSIQIAYTANLDQRMIMGTLKVANPFHHPLTVGEAWSPEGAPGWRLQTTIDGEPIGPGETGSYAIAARFEPGTDMTRIPVLSLECAAGSELNGIVSLPASPLQAYLAASRPTLAVARLAEPPVIDGVLQDPEWSGAASIPGLMNLESPAPALDPATVRCAYDDEALYLAGRFVQDPASIRVQCTQPGHPLWEDDSIEVFFDANLDRKTYQQMMITAGGVARHPNLEGVEWATGRTEDAWTVEVKVPWQALLLADAKPGDTLGFNLRRNRSTDAARRISEWTPTLSAGTPHAVDLFGTLELK